VLALREDRFSCGSHGEGRGDGFVLTLEKKKKRGREKTGWTGILYYPQGEG